MSHSFGPFQFYTKRIQHLRHFSQIACTPRKFIRRITSDSDVYKVDLDMQMSFKDEAPYFDQLRQKKVSICCKLVEFTCLFLAILTLLCLLLTVVS